jgi:hypothetical protein
MAKEIYERPGMDDITVSLEVAKMAKQKGFDSKNSKDLWYRLHNAKNFYCVAKNGQFKDIAARGEHEKVFAEFYNAPTKDTVQRWLRETHKIQATSSNPGLLRGLEQLPDVTQKRGRGRPRKNMPKA